MLICVCTGIYDLHNQSSTQLVSDTALLFTDDILTETYIIEDSSWVHSKSFSYWDNPIRSAKGAYG